MDYIEIIGAEANNLKNISLKIPRHKLVVITGLSGSGKSSLAFDTIFAEAQRRYMDTLSAYAKQFIGALERPQVESISGLSPTISIEQKSTNRNPRSTVGTITEIADFLRLLYARASKAYSPVTGKEMVRYTNQQIVSHISENFIGRKCMILSPLVVGRKGHYRELFESMIKKGYSQMRIDGNIVSIADVADGLDRYKTHFIELVVDKVVPGSTDEKRISDSVNTALNLGKGTLLLWDMQENKAHHFSKHFICPESGISYPEPAPHTFSFNSPQGACPKCKGLGYVIELDMTKIIPDDSKSIAEGGITPVGAKRQNGLFELLEAVARHFDEKLTTPIRDLPEEMLDMILYGSEELIRLGSGSGLSEMVTFPGIISRMEKEDEESESSRYSRFTQETVCPLCGGSRLKEEALAFRIDGKNIAEVSAMDIADLHEWFCHLDERLDARQSAIAADILKELKERSGFLLDVGLKYLSLNRAAKTLSGGESQRIRLATQIGSKLVNVLYILDEPSIGLHQSDNIKLINSLKKLRDEGNSVMVVEHDQEMMENADWIVDLGPGAGEKGGELLFSGPYPELLNASGLTADYLSGRRKIEIPAVRRPGNGKYLSLKGACGNNLKNVDISIPLGCFVGISGVSGSGKSTLVNETLMKILSRHFYNSLAEPCPYREIEGVENIDKLIEIDQAPIGRSPRSNPATYTGVLSDIRKLFEETPDAKIRGFKAGKFSFNVKGGRCEVCKGAGVEVIEMNFLPSVQVLCKECHGKRFKPDVLAVKYKGKSISDVLEMTISQASEFFEHVPSIHQKIKTLDEVGLGYVRLGQSSLTLSGGENQRVKLAAELSKRSTGNSLYLLDEPTTGLHSEDIKVLLSVLQRLVDQGNTVVVIEHNLDVLKSVDYLFDMGPGGGREGGRIIAEGTPESVAANPDSVTGRYLADCLRKR